MKKKCSLIILFLLFVLSACGENTSAVPQFPSPTFTKESTNTPTIVPTITQTPTPTIPDYMQEFIEKGYDKQVLDGTSMHVVLREDTVQFGEPFELQEIPGVTFSGVKWKHKIIQAWMEVSFFLDGKLVNGIVVTQWHDMIGNSTYVIEASNGTMRSDTPRSLAAVKASTEGIADWTIGENPIVTLKFGSTGNSLTDSIFDGAFPLQLYTGKESDLVYIPNVGDVLPVTWIDILESFDTTLLTPSP